MPPRPSIWQEARIGDEFARLLRHPLYRGRDVPRGDGRLVLLLPGMFAGDFYLEPTHRWLRRIGYRPVRSTLLMNVGCPQRLCQEIESSLRIQMQTRRGPVAIIGHSRGGILARALAVRLGEQASHLILLGSPAAAVVRAMDAHAALNGAPGGPAVYRAGVRARQILDPDCEVPDCGCPFPDDVRAPLHRSTRVVSIYSTEDPIVPKAACRVAGAQNHEVRGSHSGLPYNVEALRIIAEALAG